MINPGVPVAVKVPRIERDGQILKHKVDAIRREGELLQKMLHPNIVRLLWRDEDALVNGVTVPYVVLELVEEGQPINTFAAQHGLMGRDCLSLMTQVCSGVQHIHDRCSIHRDLKPGNILVDRHGVPKIIDVGLAATGNVEAERLEAGRAVGTVQYMAPEQVEGKPRLISGRTDVYALGTIAFELLARRLPLPLDGVRTLDQATRVITSTPATKLARLRPTPSHLTDLDTSIAEVSRVLDVAMRKSPGSSSHLPRWDSPSVLERQFRSVLRTGRADRSPGAARLVHSAAMFSILLAAVAVGTLRGDRLASSIGLRERFEVAAFSTPIPAASAQPFSSTAVVLVSDQRELMDVVAMINARGGKCDAFDPAKPASWRCVWIELLQALKGTGAKAAAFAIVFGEQAALGSELNAAAASAGFPVVVSIDTAELHRLQKDAARKPAFNTVVLQPPMRWGHSSGRFADDEGWWAELYLRRSTGMAWKGLALETLAAADFPDAKSQFTVDWTGRRLAVDGIAGTTSAPTVPTSAGDTRQYLITETHPESTNDEDLGVLRGDSVSSLLLAVPRSEVLQKATHSLKEVLEATPEMRRAWFENRAVFIGTTAVLDRQGNPKDLCEHPDGRKLPCVYGHATAYEALKSSAGVRRQGMIWQIVTTMAASGVPLILGGLVMLRNGNPTSRLQGRGLSWAAVLGIVGGLLSGGLLVLISYALLRRALWYAPAYQGMTAAIVGGGLLAAWSGAYWLIASRKTVSSPGGTDDKESTTTA